MTAAIATGTAFRRRAARVLPQYFTPEYHPMWPVAKLSLLLIGAFLAVFTGLFVAVGGTLALKFVSVPIAFFTVVILWLLPDVKKASEPPFEKLLVALMATRILWPSYVAVVLPGLPWLTPPRLLLGAVLVLMLVHFSQNAESRRRVMQVLGHDPATFRLFSLFIGIAFFLVPFQGDPLDTLDFTAQRLVLNLAPMVVAAWLFVNAERITPVVRTMNIVLVITMLITLVENAMSMPPWAMNIPSFMKIDPMMLDVILSPQARIGDSRYRIRSTFPVVGYYSQYVGLIMPMLIYSMLKWRGPKLVLVLLVVPLLLQTAWFINARTAFIALFMTLFGFGGLIMARNIIYPKTKDALKTGMLIAFVLALLAIVAGALAGSHRLQMYTFGGVQHAGSNDTRDQQWANTWVQLRSNPIGVGMGNSPTYVGTTNSKVPFPIVDSLWINQLVDVGIVGFFAFYLCLLRLTWVGIITFLRAGSEAEEWSGALAMSTLIFITTSYVISHYDNLHLVFIVAAATLALNRSQQLRLGINLVRQKRLPSQALVLRPI